MTERHPQPELQEEHVGVSFAAEGAVARDVVFFTLSFQYTIQFDIARTVELWNMLLRLLSR